MRACRACRAWSGQDMRRLALLYGVLCLAAGYSTLLQTYRFPHLSMESGMRYIHSPEHFLSGQSLCAPGFQLDGCAAPNQTRDHAFTVLRYHTLFDRAMRARVFASCMTHSHFLLSDAEGNPTMLGHLRIRPLGDDGFTLRCFASRIRLTGLWDVLAKQPPPEQVETAVRAACTQVAEDVNLRAYRRLVREKCL